jgi:hypothetical protein
MIRIEGKVSLETKGGAPVTTESPSFQPGYQP